MPSVYRLLLSLLLVAAGAAQAQTLPADQPPDFLPLGAYLSWERVSTGTTPKASTRRGRCRPALDALQANHVNLLWVTNLDEDALPRLITACESRNMRLLPNLGAVEARVDWRWADKRQLLRHAAATPGRGSGRFEDPPGMGTQR